MSTQIWMLRNRGMALIMVLWITAALSIIVAGLGYAVRADVRQAAALRDSASARATGRAAITLVLQELSAMNARQLDRPRHASVTYGGVAIDVVALPLNGLVDINRAPAALLAALLQHAGAMSPDAAQNLAAALVQLRSARTPHGRDSLFDAIEDLLEVPGVDYELYARLAPLITVNAGGGGQINPYAAPVPLLEVLAAGNDAAVAAFVGSRDSGIADTTGFDPSFLTNRGSSRLRLHALFAEIPPTKVSTVTCEASLAVPRTEAVPWSLAKCEYQVQAAQVR